MVFFPRGESSLIFQTPENRRRFPPAGPPDAPRISKRYACHGMVLQLMPAPSEGTLLQKYLD